MSVAAHDYSVGCEFGMCRAVHSNGEIVEGMVSFEHMTPL
jgi:hypothetical protein